MDSDEQARAIADLTKRVQALELNHMRKADSVVTVRPSVTPHYRILSEPLGDEQSGFTKALPSTHPHYREMCDLGPYAPMDDDLTTDIRDSLTEPRKRT